MTVLYQGFPPGFFFRFELELDEFARNPNSPPVKFFKTEHGEVAVSRRIVGGIIRIYPEDDTDDLVLAKFK